MFKLAIASLFATLAWYYNRQLYTSILCGWTLYQWMGNRCIVSLALIFMGASHYEQLPHLQVTSTALKSKQRQIKTSLCMSAAFPALDR